MSFFPNKPGALAGWAAGHLARYGRGVLSFSPYRPRPLAPLGPDLPATSGGRFSIRLRRWPAGSFDLIVLAIDHGADVEPVADRRAVECRVWRESVSPDRIGEKTNAAVQSEAGLPDEMPSGEVITMGIMRPSDGKCGRVDRASDVCDGRCRAPCIRSVARNESVWQTQKSEIFADRAER